jgi:hypothetical protein
VDPRELSSLARRSTTVASCGSSRMPRLLEAWVEEPEQARGRFDGDRCFARRSDAVAQRLPERSIGLAPEFVALLRSETERPDAGGVDD